MSRAFKKLWSFLSHFRPPRFSIKYFLLTVLFLFVATFIAVQVFRRYHVFEADIKLIYIDTTNSITLAEREGEAKIFMYGWSYSNKLTRIPLPKSSIRKEVNNSGYWILKTRHGTFPQNYIEFRKFQLSDDSHDVVIAIRYLLKGHAKFHVKFTDQVSGQAATVLAFNEMSDEVNGTSFCTQIVQAPEQLTRVHQVTRQAHDLEVLFLWPFLNSYLYMFQVEIVLESSGPSAFVAIDKILIAVGNERRSLHMM